MLIAALLIISKSEVETMQVPFNRGIVKELVVHTHYGTLLLNNREETINTYKNPDGSVENHAE